MGKLHTAARNGELDDAKRLIGENKAMVHEKDEVSAGGARARRVHEAE